MLGATFLLNHGHIFSKRKGWDGFGKERIAMMLIHQWASPATSTVMLTKRSQTIGTFDAGVSMAAWHCGSESL